MSRNQMNRLSLAPTVSISRSKFDLSHGRTTSFNVGELVPLWVDQNIMPGDTFDVKTDFAVRLTPMVAPVYDNLWLDIFYFFVPYRLVWSHTKEFFGENTASAWYPTTQYTIPQIEAPSGGSNVGTLADHMALPVGVDYSVSALPGRAYALICNEWFRAQQLQDPLAIPTGDSTVTAVNTGDQVTDIAKLGTPFIATKYPDYFTLAAPGPQYGQSVVIPLTENGDFPVIAKDESVYASATPPFKSLRWVRTDDGTNPTSGGGYNQIPLQASYISGNYGTVADFTSALSTGSPREVTPQNLWAHNSGQLVGASINSLRQAFQVQKFLERQAISGSRYTEIVRSMFGVLSPDSRLQRPEYLGGSHTALNVGQVVQASATTATSPQGNVAGMSFTTNSHHDFVHSFTEHGVLFALGCVRYKHKYQQGINRAWSRDDMYSFYWPLFSRLGSQTILNKEIYAQGTSADDQVFGYQERYAEYRFHPDEVTGQMRSAAGGSLDAWHFGDDYSSQPYLSSSWIAEDKSNVDRALAVSSANSNQVLADFWFNVWATRPMPLYSTPGFIDHF